MSSRRAWSSGKFWGGLVLVILVALALWLWFVPWLRALAATNAAAASIQDAIDQANAAAGGLWQRAKDAAARFVSWIGSWFSSEGE